MRRAVITACCAFLLAGTALAEKITSFEVRVDVDGDGSLVVHETIVYDFEGAQRHGIYRDVPVRYERRDADYRIRLDVLEVSDGQGTPHEYVVSNEGIHKRIRIGDPDVTVSGRRTYRVGYRVTRALLFFDEQDEVVWNATGTEWPVPIESVRVTVSLPGTAEGLRTTCYTGSFGSRASDCSRALLPGGARFETSRVLGPKEGLTVVLGFPKGIVAEPSAASRLFDRAIDFLYAGLWLPFVAFGVMYGVWRRRGRDPEGSGSIPVRYEPPEGLAPAEVGTLIDESADLDDITSTILDLAVRGHLRIHAVESTSFLFFSNTDYELEKLSEPADLKPYEAALFSGLFASGDRVAMSSLRNKFHSKLPGIRKALYAGLSGRRAFFPRSPEKVRQSWMAGGIVCGIAAVGAGAALGAMSLAIAFLVSGGIIVLFGRVMPRRSARGRRAYEEILGFKEFLSRVDRDRLERLGTRSVETFEKLLPYAIVLGVADQWADAFADLYREPPTWYVGHGPFRPRPFVSDVGRSLQTMGQTLSSQPRGSGGSGFGGGGFSGGGFGGGGGGSW